MENTVLLQWILCRKASRAFTKTGMRARLCEQKRTTNG
jgi:hypothetical protein